MGGHLFLMRRGVPPEMEKFVLHHIDTVHTLDVLLLLYHSPDRLVSAHEVLEQVKSNIDAVGESLAHLIDSSLIKCVDPNRGLFQYKPLSAFDDKLTGALDLLYSERYSAVIEIIYSKPLTEAKNFAEAFRLRRKRPE